MTSLISNFLGKTDFESYDDFYTNFKINIPDNFNFVYDVVDRYAREQPEKRLLSGVTMMAKKRYSLLLI